MDDLETILQSIKRLSPNEQRQLFQYLQRQQIEQTLSPKPRILDLHPGAFLVSDDFDDELPDSFWLTEDTP